MQISVNPLAEFSKATEAKKRTIIRNQKDPDPFRVSLYQLARARMRLAIAKKGDISPILDGINELKMRQPTKVRQIANRDVSVEALERFLQMKLPTVLKDIDYEVVKKPKKDESRSLVVKGVEVIVSPDLIIKTTIDGQTYLGAVKIHIAKSSIFDNNQLKHIASATYMYLQHVIADETMLVLPELCLAYDIFGNRIAPAPQNIKKGVQEIEVICQEVKEIWPKV